MTVAEAGLPEDTQRGWRRALFFALSDGEKPASRRSGAVRSSRISSAAAVQGLQVSGAVIAILPQGCACAHRAAAAGAEALRRGLQGADGGNGKTLTALGSYWKGRKPLILNKACILGCLLPATDDPVRDLEIFEKLMAMDDESFVSPLEAPPEAEGDSRQAFHRPH